MQENMFAENQQLQTQLINESPSSNSAAVPDSSETQLQPRAIVSEELQSSKTTYNETATPSNQVPTDEETTDPELAAIGPQANFESVDEQDRNVDLNNKLPPEVPSETSTPETSTPIRPARNQRHQRRRGNARRTNICG